MLAVSLAVIFLFFILRGAWRGLTGELAPLAGIAACLGVVFFAYGPLRATLASTLTGLDGQAHTFYAAVTVAVIGGILFLVVAQLIKRVGEVLVPQPFNAILGALIGAGKVFLIASLIAGVVSVAREKAEKALSEQGENPLTAAALTFWQAQIQDLLPQGESVLPELKRRGEELPDGNL